MVFFFVFFLVVQVLKQNIKKPQYYVAGYVTVPPEFSNMASSYSHMFIALYAEDNDRMPFGASRQEINHDFSRGDLHFVLNEQNFFVMQKGRDFPRKFKIKVSLSNSDKVTPGSSAQMTATLSQVPLGETKLSFTLVPELQAKAS